MSATAPRRDPETAPVAVPGGRDRPPLWRVHASVGPAVGRHGRLEGPERQGHRCSCSRPRADGPCSRSRLRPPMPRSAARSRQRGEVLAGAATGLRRRRDRDHPARGRRGRARRARGAVMTAVQGTPMTTSYLRLAPHRKRPRAWRRTSAPSRHGSPTSSARPSAGRPRSTWTAGSCDALRSRSAATSASTATSTGWRRFMRRLRTTRGSAHGGPRRPVVRERARCREGRSPGVVDWEAGAIAGEPVRDLVRFALMYALYLDRRTQPGRRVAGHPELRTGRWGAGSNTRSTARAGSRTCSGGSSATAWTRLGAPPAIWRDAALAGIAEVAALTDDPEFARPHLELFRRLSGERSGWRAAPSAADRR